MTDLLEKEVDALVAARVYETRDDLLVDAVRTLFRARPQLRLRSALHLYRSEEVSLARGAELSGLCLEDFKQALADAGSPREIEAPTGADWGRELNWLREVTG